MSPFDPFGWAERVVPARRLHRLIRGVMLVVCAGFLARRIVEFPSFRSKILWAAETAVFLVLVVAYWVRSDPVDRARGWKEVLVPLAGGLLPFSLLTSAPHPAVWSRPWALEAVFAVMAAATALTVWGLWHLRGSFSITVEARRLVTTGPYRWVRHPVYLGEIGSAGAVAAWRASWANLGLFVLFVAIQLTRARCEEAKLAGVFPGYAAFAGRTWWVPHLRDLVPWRRSG